MGLSERLKRAAHEADAKPGAHERSDLRQGLTRGGCAAGPQPSHVPYPKAAPQGQSFDKHQIPACARMSAFTFGCRRHACRENRRPQAREILCASRIILLI